MNQIVLQAASGNRGDSTSSNEQHHCHAVKQMLCTDTGTSKSFSIQYSVHLHLLNLKKFEREHVCNRSDIMYENHQVYG